MHGRSVYWDRKALSLRAVALFMNSRKDDEKKIRVSQPPLSTGVKYKK